MADYWVWNHPVYITSEPFNQTRPNITVIWNIISVENKRFKKLSKNNMISKMAAKNCQTIIAFVEPFHVYTLKLLKF